MRCAGRRLHGALLVSQGFLAKYGGAREFARQRGEKAGLLRTGGLDGEILGANEQLMQAAEEVDGAARVEDAEMADGDVADGRDAHEGPRQGGGGLEVGPQGIVLLLRRTARHLAEDGGYVLDCWGFVSWRVWSLGLGAWGVGRGPRWRWGSFTWVVHLGGKRYCLASGSFETEIWRKGGKVCLAMLEESGDRR